MSKIRFLWSILNGYVQRFAYWAFQFRDLPVYDFRLPPGYRYHSSSQVVGRLFRYSVFGPRGGVLLTWYSSEKNPDKFKKFVYFYAVCRDQQGVACI